MGSPIKYNISKKRKKSAASLQASRKILKYLSVPHSNAEKVMREKEQSAFANFCKKWN